ncbi:MAG: hypothetical protein H7177_15065 [Rhizobacter sp.]|nr:hypothetical protein [Bacteriovorax sp.]
MKIILLLVLVIPSIALAEKQMTKKDMSVLGKIDASNFQQQPNEKKPDAVIESKKEVATMNCKDKAGVVYNQGQVGYDNCLNDLKNRSDFSKKNSGVNVNNSNNKDGSGAGINFKIGD